ncbi:protein of unknown function (DUF4429) [Micromonospora viridifaciens]|uniref:Short C-terminal domain-containing protein n=1 Tax=Micromonospora viridifaciens TaxID=1881 RepID=A0A1C4ZNA1_MICVI|nr:DUF4429 domain-containing protein [Micromonospora viridifaciens]SCF34418.1 protein of unknown function (DUF4429) [Micromonospora viridifaciens]
MTRPPTDAERQHHVAALHTALAENAIDLAQFEQLLTEVLRADALDEIERVTSALQVMPFQIELRGHDGTAVLERDRIVLEFPRRLTTQGCKVARSPRTIPLPAVAWVEFECKWSGGHVRLRLVGEAPEYRPRPPSHDANALEITADQRDTAEAFVAEVRHRIQLEPRTPEPQLLPPQHRVPGLPPPPRGELFVQLRDLVHEITLDENGVLLEFRGGPKQGTRRWLPLTAIASVEFAPPQGFRNGYVRFILAGLPAGYRRPAPKRDPDAFEFTVGRDEGVAEELAAHVAARITGPRVVEPSLLPGNDPASWPPEAGPHTTTPATPTSGVPGQLRELARLRAEGIITGAEYEAKKQELLRRW